VQGVALSGDLVIRHYDNQYAVRETNRIWNRAGTALVRPNYRNGIPETVFDLETPAAAQRRYVGLTTAVHKREGALKLTAAYTLSQLRGNVFSNEQNPWGLIPPQDIYQWGYLGDDSRHVFRSTMTYRWTRWLTTGVTYSYASGRPYDRFFRNDVTRRYDDLRARTGTN